MAYTVLKLINNAYYLSGIVARNQQTVTGQQQSDGLDLLNDLLGIKTANNRLIPYFSQYSFNAVIGQETYFIENLIDSETVTFNQQTVRYSMMEQSRKRYFGTARVDNINALPFGWHLERTKGGANLFLYFRPVDTFLIKIMGKFGLVSVELDDDLSASYDRFYIVYLKYALAEYLCTDFNIVLPPQTQKKLNEIEQIITDISPIDFSVDKGSSLQNGVGLNWAMVNFPGWVPS
jgi:hypothetical protein